MKHYEIPIYWNGHSARETKNMLSEGIARLPSDLQELVTFDIPVTEKPLGTLTLDPGIVIAMVSSSVALAASVLSCIAQIASARMSKHSTIMKATLEDGTSIEIPTSATKSEIEALLGAVSSLQSIKTIRLLSQQ